MPNNDWTYYIPYGPALWEQVAKYPQSVFRRVNTITKIMEFDCRGLNDAWMLIVETALPAAGELVLALLEFDWDDIARGFLRPYGLRARSKPRKSRRKKGFVPEIPEIGELIGENLPGSQLVKASKINNALRWLWVIDGALQRALWYWMVFDLTLDFFYNWTTGIMTSARCAHGEHGGMHATADHLGSLGPVYQASLGCALQWQGEYQSWGDDPCRGIGFSSPHGTLQVAWGASLECVTGDKTATLTVGLRTQSGHRLDESPPAPVAREMSDSALTLGHHGADTLVIPYYTITGSGGVYYLRNVVMTASH